MSPDLKADADAWAKSWHGKQGNSSAHWKVHKTVHIGQVIITAVKFDQLKQTTEVVNDFKQMLHCNLRYSISLSTLYCIAANSFESLKIH
jgi:hypothetical protein